MVKKISVKKFLLMFIISCAIIFGCTAFLRDIGNVYADGEPAPVPVTDVWQDDSVVDTTSWYDSITYEDVDNYLISKPEELAGLAKLVNSGVDFEGKTIKLTNNIELGEIDKETNILTDGRIWTPIGTEENPFKGTFDGDKYSISGLYVNLSGEDAKYIGLFGNVEGKILNISVRDSFVCGHSYVGTISGALKGDIEGCSTYLTIVADEEGASKIGGLVGALTGTEDVSSSTINCYNNGKVFARGTYIGGVVGFANLNCSVKNTYNLGEISSTGTYVGGVVGFALKKVSISASYNSATITHNNTAVEQVNLGGVVGCLNDECEIVNSYNEGEIVSSGDCVGGLVGMASNSVIDNSYNTKTITAHSTIGGVVGMTRSSKITNSYNNGDIKLSLLVKVFGKYVNGIIGGIVGDNTLTSISYCNNTGKIVGEYEEEPVDVSYVGGIAGKNYQSNITITFNKGVVGSTDSQYVGGIVGKNDKGVLTNQYTTGEVIGKDFVGGLVAENVNGGTIRNCVSSAKMNLPEGYTTVGSIVAKIDALSKVLDTYFNEEITGVKASVGYNEDTNKANITNVVAYTSENMGSLEGVLSDGSYYIGVLDALNKVSKEEENPPIWTGDGSSVIVFDFPENNSSYSVAEILAIILASFGAILLVVYLIIYIKEVRAKAQIPEFDGYGKDDFEDMENSL